jgi:lysophospholipase L1-like esterase
MKQKMGGKLPMYGGIVIVILLFVTLLFDVVSSVRSSKVDVSEGIAYIEQVEQADVVTIEQKIEKLESDEQEAAQEAFATVTSRNYKSVFSHAVIMGDSITEAFTAYDYLHASSVVAQIGAQLQDMDEQIEKVVQINPQYIFLTYGINDILSTDGDTALFVERYDALLKQLQASLPSCKIFVNSIFPVQQQQVEKEPVFAQLQTYNEALEALCDKRKIAFLNNSDLIEVSDYEEDGLHFKSAFYPKWLNRMMEVAGL